MTSLASTATALAWPSSLAIRSSFCVAALEEVLRQACPEISNTDQGSQFMSEDFVGPLERAGIRISMDGRGRFLDNIFVERLWRTVKYEDLYLHDYEMVADTRAGLVRFFSFYNEERFHQSLDYRTPAQVYLQGPCLAGATA